MTEPKHPDECFCDECLAATAADSRPSIAEAIGMFHEHASQEARQTASTLLDGYKPDEPPGK